LRLALPEPRLILGQGDGYSIVREQDGLANCRFLSRTHVTYEQALEHAARIAQETGVSWRMPTREELESLKSLIDKTRKDPAIDTFVFPDTPSSRFWSSSPFVGSANYAWYVGFNYGFVGNVNRGYTLAVRLVRGG